MILGPPSAAGASPEQWKRKIPEFSIILGPPVSSDVTKIIIFYNATAVEARIEAGFNEPRWSVDGI